LQATVSSEVRVIELDAHINDESFALAAVDLLVELLR